MTQQQKKGKSMGETPSAAVFLRETRSCWISLFPLGKAVSIRLTSKGHKQSAGVTASKTCIGLDIRKLWLPAKRGVALIHDELDNVLDAHGRCQSVKRT